MLKIVIIEDNLEYLDVISLYINESLKANSIEGHIMLKACKAEEVEVYLEKETPNVFFIDIDLNSKTNGIEVASIIKKRLNNSYIIFITNYIKYMLEAFEIHAYHFIPKPAQREVISRCLLDISNEIREQMVNDKNEKDIIIIKSGYRDLFIKKHEILLIEKQGNKAIIYTFNGQYSCYLSLDYFEELLKNNSNFFRCHKSFIVNKEFIREIRFNKLEIELLTGKVCFLSRKFRKGLDL